MDDVDGQEYRFPIPYARMGAVPFRSSVIHGRRQVGTACQAWDIVALKAELASQVAATGHIQDELFLLRLSSPVFVLSLGVEGFSGKTGLSGAEVQMFLKNAWYVAGWSKEFGRELSPRLFLDQSIVIYRKNDGSPVVLEDACPHRKLPLSKGRLLGDSVECGYHGLTFDGNGMCVAAPTQPDSLPHRAVVKSYPAVDRYRLLWVWMGDSDRANPDDIFPIENYDDVSWGCTEGGALDIDCNYLWLADNLLDPSHVAWVHVGSFAGAGTDNSPLDISKTERGVIVSRWIFDQPPSPYYAGLVKFDGSCDRLQHYEMCYPAIGLNKSVYTPAGTGGYDMTENALTYVNISYHFMTPVDENRTRYFWFQHRNTDPHDRAISEQMNEGARLAFEEDREVLVEVHRGMANRRTPNINLGLDAGAKLFRRGLDRLIDAS